MLLFVLPLCQIKGSTVSLNTYLGSLPGLTASSSFAVTWLPDYIPSMKWSSTCFAEDCETCLGMFVKCFKDQTTTAK